MIDGRTPNEHRTDRTTGQEIMSRSEIVEDFQPSENDRISCSDTNGGLGITLHAASICGILQP
jgi:hypothetical protein